MSIDPEILHPILLMGTLLLASFVTGLALLSTHTQWRLDRANRLRIACHQRWERELPRYLFGPSFDLADLAVRSEEERTLFRNYLERTRAAIRGEEVDRILELYRMLRLEEGLRQRLDSRSPKVRALAAAEVGLFELNAHYPDLVPLLADEQAHVAYAAARSLCQSKDLRHAAPVLSWIQSQPYYQVDRVAAILDAFCPVLLPWLEAHLPEPAAHPREWRLYARLVGVHRYWQAIPRLRSLMGIDDLELRCAALHAFQVLANPEPWDAILPFATAPDPVLRMHALRALGNVGGPRATPLLLDALADPSYDVRRHASMALADIGSAGVENLKWVAEDASADPFARDMARERLDWLRAEGRL